MEWTGEDQAIWDLVGHVKSFGLYSGLWRAIDEFHSKTFDQFYIVEWWLRKQHGEWLEREPDRREDRRMIKWL